MPKAKAWLNLCRWYAVSRIGSSFLVVAMVVNCAAYVVDFVNIMASIGTCITAGFTGLFE